MSQAVTDALWFIAAILMAVALLTALSMWLRGRNHRDRT